MNNAIRLLAAALLLLLLIAGACQRQAVAAPWVAVEIAAPRTL
jgi:hypothetical protein